MVNCVAGERSKKYAKKYFRSEKEEIEQSEVTGGEFMNMMFDLFDLIFPVMFLLIFGMILFTFISGIRTWNKNNNSPRLTVEARVASSDRIRHITTSRLEETLQELTGIILPPAPLIMLLLRWKAVIGWNFLYMEKSMECWQKETKES